MLTIVQALVLGLVQGITEWLPISSSGHLVILNYLFSLNEPLAYIVMLHLASLVVILLYYREQLLALILGIVHREKESLTYAGYLVLGTLPVALAGIFLKDTADQLFSSPKAVGVALFITSGLLFLTKSSRRGSRINCQKSVLIGIAQAFAIFPGISRSGVTIAVAMLLGLSGKKAAKFSFFLAIPAILGALILTFPQVKMVNSISLLLLSMSVTVIAGYLSLHFLLNIMQRGRLYYFAWYCLILGFALVTFL